MEFKFNDELGVTDVYIKDDDVCKTCPIVYDCPLIACISLNFVYPSAEVLNFADCSYKEKLTKEKES